MLMSNLDKIRQVDLFNFLLIYDPSGWRQISQKVIVGILHDSCKVTLGKGWYWFAQNKGSRNPIEFLMLYYGLTFREATQIMDSYLQLSYSEQCKYYDNTNYETNKEKVLRVPPVAERPWQKLLDYLTVRRCIKDSLVESLVNRGLVYQTTGYYANVCFINATKNHWEIVGMHPTKRYRQVSDASNYWAYELGSKRAYICESAIDAISLCELIQDKEATYVSIAGSVTRARLINRVIKEYPEVILAVDNDDAGNKVAAMYPRLRRIISQNKDFNDDLAYEKKG